METQTTTIPTPADVANDIGGSIASAMWDADYEYCHNANTTDILYPGFALYTDHQDNGDAIVEFGCVEFAVSISVGYGFNFLPVITDLQVRTALRPEHGVGLKEFSWFIQTVTMAIRTMPSGVGFCFK